MGRSAIGDRKLDCEGLHRTVDNLAAEREEKVLRAGHVHHIGVYLHFGQLVQVHNLVEEAVKIELASTLLHNAPVFELEGRLCDCLLDQSCVLHPLAVGCSVLLLKGREHESDAPSQHRHREARAPVQLAHTRLEA